MKKNTLIKIIILIIIIILMLLIYNQLNKLIYITKTIEAYINYNDEQKKCLVVGTTNNYVYITRQKTINEPIEGAIWNIVGIRGNIIGTFKTDKLGQGGIVGLECGEYFLEEQSVPKPYEGINKKYKIIISNIDTYYSLNIVNEIQENGIVFVVKNEKGESLKGVKLAVYDKEENKVADLITNQKGLARDTKNTSRYILHCEQR